MVDAKATLKERLDELEKTMNSAQTQFSQVAERINSGRGRLESLLATARERETLKRCLRSSSQVLKALVTKVTTTELKSRKS